MEDQDTAAWRVSICLQPEDAEELYHVARYQAGDGPTKPAQMPMGKVMDDGAEPWKVRGRQCWGCHTHLKDTTHYFPISSQPVSHSYLGLPAPQGLSAAAQPSLPRDTAKGGFR